MRIRDDGRLFIYFSDLTPEAQKVLLEWHGVSSPEEMNWDMDIVPLEILDRPEEL